MDRPWGKSEGQGTPGKRRVVVALGVGGCPRTQEGCPRTQEGGPRTQEGCPWTQEGCPPPRRRRDLVRYGLACAHSV